MLCSSSSPVERARGWRVFTTVALSWGHGIIDGSLSQPASDKQSNCMAILTTVVVVSGGLPGIDIWRRMPMKKQLENGTYFIDEESLIMGGMVGAEREEEEGKEEMEEKY